MVNAALSAFSVFFSQSPSFLDWQILMEQAKGINNAKSLFSAHQIPSLTQIRNLPDSVAPSTLFPLMSAIGDMLFGCGHLSDYRSIDGTDFLSSQNICCPCCCSAKLANGVTQYRHIAVTPAIVAPGCEQAIGLPSQFVEPQDGHRKQDCELAPSAGLNGGGAFPVYLQARISCDDL